MFSIAKHKRITTKSFIFAWMNENNKGLVTSVEKNSVKLFFVESYIFVVKVKKRKLATDLSLSLSDANALRYVIRALPSSLFSMHNWKKIEKISRKRVGKQTFFVNKQDQLFWNHQFCKGKTVDGNTCVT